MKSIAIHDGHNAAAALMEDGTVTFAVQEERLVREKNRGGFPHAALQEILKRSGLSLPQIDHFVFTGHIGSLETFGRDEILQKYAQLAAVTGRTDADFQPGSIAHIKSVIKEALGHDERETYIKNHKRQRVAPLTALGIDAAKISYIEHHTCHAASAAFGWERDEPCLVLTSDSHGDYLSGTVSIFEHGRLNRLAEIDMNDSLGRIYSLITYLMGMVPMEHEYKIMGLAPYAEKTKQARDIADRFHALFQLDDSGLRIIRAAGMPPAPGMAALLREIMDCRQFHHISAGLQLFLEEIVLTWVRTVIAKTGLRNIALAGGLFMNVKLNMLIAALDEVEDLFIFPSCGDESNVFGALYQHYFEMTGKLPAPLQAYYMGGDFTNEEIERALQSYRFENCDVTYTKEDDIHRRTGHLLAENIVVARFDGRMEFGARSLGNRSILANPADPDVITRINKMIKSRDFWMPFAPSMTKSQPYIENPKNIDAPYMIMAFPARAEKLHALRGAIHPYDLSCRPQIVYPEWNPGYYKVIESFAEKTGEHVILNTSFNLHGLPVAYTPEDALYVMDHSGLTHMAMGDYLVVKK